MWSSSKNHKRPVEVEASKIAMVADKQWTANQHSQMEETGKKLRAYTCRANQVLACEGIYNLLS
jgi:hypothetical protein